MVKFNKQYTGKITIGIFPIKEHIKNQTVPSGKYKGEQFNIKNTHTVAFKIPEIRDQWITFAHKKFNEGYPLILQDKDGDKYTDIYNGSKVNFWYGESTPNAEGKTFINIDYKSLRILEFAECDQKIYYFGDRKDGSNDSGEVPKAPAYNPIGAIKGNAFKCAVNLVKGKLIDPKFTEFVQGCKDVNAKLASEFKGTHEGMTIGMCVYEASRFTKTTDKMYEWAKDALTTYIGVVDDVFDGKTPDAPREEAPKPEKEDPKPTDPPEDINEQDLPF